MANILVTGATGFVGKRLIACLLQEGHVVYALVRGSETSLMQHPNLHVLYGDLKETVEFPKEIDAAYYLIHSMSDKVKKLLDAEKIVAEHFVEALKETSVKQIIYLGGIINEKVVSQHLAARLLVESILKAGTVPTTILRASIIIGKGSASFQIIRDLVEKLPVMVAPRWIKSRCQPIAIEDVLFYLQGVLLRKECFNRTFDIGGRDTVSFKELLLAYASIHKLKRYIFTLPVLTPKLSSYWLVFITKVRFSLASYLVGSMKVDTICQDNEIKKVLPHACMGYREAMELV